MKKIINQQNANPAIKEYTAVLQDIKNRIREAQIKAMLAANRELLKLYWHIGKIISYQQKENGWGSKTIDALANDIQQLFPGLSGFSRSNVFRMKAFFEAYEIVAQAVRPLDDLPLLNIPWGHNVIILQRIKSTEERFWYAQKAIENGWSRSMLEIWIESDLYHREGAAITNFRKTLPSSESDMAQQSFKDPYIFDFLTLHQEHQERDIEQGLIDNLACSYLWLI